MSDDRLERIEEKLDRIAETLAAKVARDEVTQSDVEKLKNETRTMRTMQDQQRGAVHLITILSVCGGVLIAYVELARFMGGH